MLNERLQDYQILENQKLADQIYRMTLLGDTSWVKKPGQFLNIAIDNAYLRRPISICEQRADQLVIIYKTVGFGTRQLAGKQPGERINALIGLGNGFTVNEQPALLLGGGVGVPPLYGLAKALAKQRIPTIAILGFNQRSEVFYEKEFQALCDQVLITTADGSYGYPGFVTDLLSQPAFRHLYYYACGPELMLKAVFKTSQAEGQLSFEARMGCGFGACMGCSCATLTGAKRICVEGPVMSSKELLWND